MGRVGRIVLDQGRIVLDQRKVALDTWVIDTWEVALDTWGVALDWQIYDLWRSPTSPAKCSAVYGASVVGSVARGYVRIEESS